MLCVLQTVALWDLNPRHGLSVFFHAWIAKRSKGLTHLP
jgi:hypothetical protein